MKYRIGFISNSSSSSFILQEGNATSFVKVYGDGVETRPDGSVVIVLMKLDRLGVPYMSDELKHKLEFIFKMDEFKHIKRIKANKKNEVITDGSTSYIYQDDGCFYIHLYGDQDIELKGLIERALKE